MGYIFLHKVNVTKTTLLVCSLIRTLPVTLSKEKKIERLKILQRKLLRRRLGLMESSPNLFVSSEFSELPLRFRKEFILLKSTLKMN